MNDFGDDLWTCRFCAKAFTDDKWTNLVPKWAHSEANIPLLLHDTCIQPYRVRERLLK